jgi:hypothetical protein
MQFPSQWWLDHGIAKNQVRPHRISSKLIRNGQAHVEKKQGQGRNNF